MSNYKVELERTEKQDLQIKKHISDVKDIVKSKVNKDVNGLNSIKKLLENETLGGYIVDDFIKIDNLEVVDFAPDKNDYHTLWTFLISKPRYDSVRTIISNANCDLFVAIYNKSIIKISNNGEKEWELPVNCSDIEFFNDGVLGVSTVDGEMAEVSQDGEIVSTINLHNGEITRMKIDSENNIYFGTSNGKIVKSSRIGKSLFEFTKYSSRVYSIDIDSLHNTVFCFNDSAVVKISESGKELWVNTQSKYVNTVRVASNDYIHSCSNDGKIMRLDEHGTIEWTSSITDGGSGMALDSGDNTFYSSNDQSGENGRIIKLSSEGKKVMNIASSKAWIGVVSTDAKDNIYYDDNKEPSIKKIELKRELLGYKVLKVERG